MNREGARALPLSQDPKGPWDNPEADLEITSYGRCLLDFFPADEERQQLEKFVPLLGATKGGSSLLWKEEFVDTAIRKLFPICLEAAGFASQAAVFRALPRVCPETMATFKVAINEVNPLVVEARRVTFNRTWEGLRIAEVSAEDAAAAKAAERIICGVRTCTHAQGMDAVSDTAYLLADIASMGADNSYAREAASRGKTSLEVANIRRANEAAAKEARKRVYAIAILLMEMAIATTTT